MPVRQLRSKEELAEFLTAKKALLLKHSTRCPVSAGALAEFKAFMDKHPDAMEYAMVLVVEDSLLSNHIAGQYGIRHESPQAIYFENSRPVWNASHQDITVANLEALL